MKAKYIWFVLMGCMGFVACESDDDNDSDMVVDIPLDAGNADFSNFVAVGASFTAGFTDGALFIASQENSFPNIMARQMAEAGGGEMSQPFMSDNVGGLTLGGVQIANPRLFFNGSGPEVLPGIPTTEVTNIQRGPFNNMGVPGAKSFHLLAPGYGNVQGVALGQANPYYARMATDPNATILGDAAAQGASFFTISEIGGNDVLGYATSGGSGTNQTGNFDPSTYGPNDITDPTVFGATMEAIVATMVNAGGKGVIANVPYVTSLPYFTTVPHNPVPLDAATAALVNAGYADYNNGLALAEAGGLISGDEVIARTIAFNEGNNSVVIIDEDLTDLSGLGIPSYRQATSEDLPVLTSSAFIGTLVDGNPLLINGVTVPLEDQWVLTSTETAGVIAATDQYNTAIEALASNFSLGFVDLKAILQQASTTGYPFDDFFMTTDLVVGGLVSLDGVHLTARGYALMANEFLLAIDQTYGSNFAASGSLAKANDYPVAYPTQF